MVTFIVVMLLILCSIAFAVYLAIKKGKVLKRWFFAFGGVVLAGIICIAVAVPVTSSKVKEQMEEFASYREIRLQWIFMDIYNGSNLDQEFLQRYNELFGEEIAFKNAWLEKQQKLIVTGIYWDLKKEYQNKIIAFNPIPHVELENGEYVLKDLTF